MHTCGITSRRSIQPDVQGALARTTSRWTTVCYSPRVSPKLLQHLHDATGSSGFVSCNLKTECFGEYTLIASPYFGPRDVAKSKPCFSAKATMRLHSSTVKTSSTCSANNQFCTMLRNTVGSILYIGRICDRCRDGNRWAWLLWVRRRQLGWCRGFG